MADEFNLEDWWEESSEDLHINPSPSDVERGTTSTISVELSNVWGDVGTIGGPPAIAEDEMEEMLAKTYKSFPKTRQANEWFYVIRRCSDKYDVTEYLLASEKILYDSKVSTEIKHYTSLATNETYFHVFRAFARAREGDFEAAKILWDDIHANWLHNLNDYRKPYVLAHLYATSICSKEWEQSNRYLRQLWSIVKFMDGTKRHAFGIWDEWIACLLIMWIFMKHSDDFLQFFCEKYPGQPSPFGFQRKSIIIKNLDVSFIADVIEQPYYKLARELYPSLPEVHYEEKEIAQLRL